ncbi:MAG: hypothetical protein M0R29_00385 [Aquamicrobium sp.]|nr:hypothetical protein [Aquamicrobium sp.]
MPDYYDATSYGLRARLWMFVELQKWSWVALFRRRKVNIKLAVRQGEY